MDFEQFSAAAAAYARENGISDYQLYYQADSSDQFSVFAGELDQLASAQVEGVSLCCLVNGKKGTASTELFTAEEIPILFHRALEAAGFTGDDTPETLVTGGEYQPVSSRNVEMSDAAEVKERLLTVEKVGLKADDRVQKGLMAEIANVSSRRAISNSAGLYLESQGSMSVFFVDVVASDASGKKYNDHMVDAKADSREMDIEKLVGRAVEKTVAQIGAATVPSGHYPIIFDNSQMTAMLEIFASVFSASQVQDGLSLLKGKVGQQIASEAVTLVDDPFYPGSFFPCAFDAEGVPTRTKTVIEKGVLKQLLYDCAAARKDGVESTGNAYRSSYDAPVGIAPFTFYMQPGTLTREQLMQKAGKAIMITFMKGAHAGANPVTGDFSLESKGFLVENGKIVRAVEEITVAGNFFQMLKDITDVADDLSVNTEDGISCCGAPSVLVSDLAVAGC